ncbi:MAG: hypothetical protein GY804_11855, partial [Alphaproteobacteria bacterium]|nr:hypothetical protein [Alphaproteobacteria bacterium]
KTHKMSDLYSCSKSYKSIINTIKKNKPIENFEIEIQTPKGDKLSVLNTSKLIMYKGENCKITSFIDVTEEKKFKYLATIDELTGIRNRRSIMEFASSEFQRCKCLLQINNKMDCSAWNQCWFCLTACKT